MRWLPFTVLALVMIVLQTAVARYMAIRGIWPDLMFILAVHYALWGPWPEAAIASWILGLIVGLASQDRIGLHALCFATAAWAIFRVRQAVFRDHPLTQLVVTLLACLVVQVAVGIYNQWSASEGTDIRIWGPAFFTAIYTAALAPYLHWGLQRLGRWTGLRSLHAAR